MSKQKTSQEEYYKDELNAMERRAKECDSRILKSIEYFMDESNAHMAGIDPEIGKHVKDHIRQFMSNCTCGKIQPYK